MKTVGEVRQKLKQVKYRHLKKELEKALTKTSSNCTHNQLLDVPNLGEVSICSLKEGTIVCDSHLELDLAPSCSLYACRNQKEDVKSEVEEIFSSSIPRVAVLYPDAAALMWVLDEGASEEAPLPDPKVAVGTFYGVPIYTDSPQGKDVFSQAINELQDEPLKLATLLRRVQEELDGAQNALTRSEGELSSLRGRLDLLEKEELLRVARIEDLNKIIDRLEGENERLRSSWLPGRFQ